MRWLLLAVVVALAGAWQGWTTRAIHHLPGELASADPVQRPLGSGPMTFHRGDAEIVARAGFELEAVVIGRERYRFDRMSKLVPVDVAFGWGPMSDSSVLSHLAISQSNRFYFWSTPEFPIPRRAIETHSANMHLIPATDAIERRIENARVGQVVRLSGYLVDVKTTDGWAISTSLTREDTGAGACEVIWVESFD